MSHHAGSNFGHLEISDCGFRIADLWAAVRLSRFEIQMAERFLGTRRYVINGKNVDNVAEFENETISKFENGIGAESSDQRNLSGS